jgi:glutamate 5-kinase
MKMIRRGSMPALEKDLARPAALIKAARRITIKVVSSLLVESEGSGIREPWLHSVAKDIATLRESGKQVTLVSSGAVALGCRQLSLKRSPRLAIKQAAAAAGQPLLMQSWAAALAPFGIPTAQLLLTLDDTESRRRWLNARATMEVILARDAVPVINENDTVATEELRYGDNDRLSARVAQMIQSDLLILLSDVDGLYTADPARDGRAQHVPHIAVISEETEQWAGGASRAGFGTGGMRTKIAAARVAQSFGCATIIASGRDTSPLSRLQADDARATVVDAAGSPARAYKQWIAGSLVPAGSVHIDVGAQKALAAGKSLLPAGATAVEGTFERGVCLRILGAQGKEVARGITSYTSSEMQAILGCASREIEGRLGYSGPDELIHRNDLVLM